MNAQQLKKSILQMAISGKLVPQDPNDEPASVLLERIRKEKEKLIKEGKIKKEKNPSYIFRGADNTPYEKVGKNEPVSIADEVPFEIPKSWEWARIGSVFSLQAGKNISSADISDTKFSGSFPCYGGNGLRGYVDHYNRDGYFPLIGRQGALCGNINFAQGKFYATEHAVVVESFGGTDVTWAGLFLEAMNLNQYATATAQPGLAVANINKLLIPIPPVPEQIRIVIKFSELIPYVLQYDQTERRLATLNEEFPEQLKKSILQLAVQGKLVPQDPNDEPASVLLERIRAEKERLIAEGKIKRDKNESVIFRRDNSHYEKLDKNEVCIDSEVPFELPDSWAWTRLGNLISLLSGQDFEPSGYNDVGRGIPYITGASNIDDGKVAINRWTECPKNIAHGGELLIVCKGAGVGKMAVLNEEAHIARQIMSILPINTNLLYLQVVLAYNLEHLRRNMQGVIPGISRSDVLRLLCPVPPLDEQERIVNRIEAILTLVKSL